MASINGVSLKGIKTFRGHEGERLTQGNIYIDDKKVGFWSQDAWGGPDSYEADNPEIKLYEMIRERADRFKEGYPENGSYRDLENEPDVFMGHLVNLTSDEKTWKKYRKQGYPYLVVVTNNWKVIMSAFKNKVNADMFGAEQAETETQQGKRKFKYYVYSNQEDFNVTVNKNHEAPEYLVD